jgi:pre-mRNA-processing factor 40
MLAECVWKEHKTDAGKIYYYNSETKESVWDEPEELARVKRMAARYVLTHYVL